MVQTPDHKDHAVEATHFRKDVYKKLQDQPLFVEEFLDELTVNTTELFRDPGFWRLLRQEIIPAIRINNSEFRILHAGCSSGEEVLSMAIVLKEMGIYDNVSIIATDLDNVILQRARLASYPMKNMEINEKNYLRFEGGKKLTDYYSENDGKANVRPRASEKCFFPEI